MTHQDQTVEQWAQRLADKTSEKDADPQLDALRAAIQASDQSVSDSSAEDRLAHARLIKRLEREGLLRSRPRWQLIVGAAAAVLIAAIGLRIALLTDVVDRGFAGSVTIVAQDPAAELMQVIEQLRALGLQPRRVTEDGRVLIEVEVTQAQLPVFYQWAQARGGRPVTAGTYRIFIDGETAVTR